MRFKRVLLKASGEIIWNDPQRVAREVASAVREGFQVAVVMGGGNVIRGVEAKGIRREVADHMGMIATAVNALLLEDFLRSEGQRTAILSPLPIGGVVQPYSYQRALEALEEGRVVLLPGGTGNPYFSTDTAAAIRAMELGCDCLLKGTKVDGVYEEDPKVAPQAKRFSRLTYSEYLRRGLKVMDETAVLLCSRGGLPIVVFDLSKPGELMKALTEGGRGTIIS